MTYSVGSNQLEGESWWEAVSNEAYLKILHIVTGKAFFTGEIAQTS